MSSRLSQRARRVLIFMSRLIPIILAAGLLALLDNSETPTPLEHSQIAEVKPSQERLVIFWIDSLAKQDMDPESPHMSRLKKQLDKSLHGPVLECVDAISVPCFTAMATGLDRFSLFSLFSNFGGAKGIPDENVFQLLQKNGHRLGFVGAPSVAPVVQSFDWVETHAKVDDALSVQQGLQALDREHLSVVIMHLYNSDKTSHFNGVGSPEYAASLDHADELIEKSLKRLRPTDHVVVMGDHGHMPDGRHFAGLQVPTYIALFGPTFHRTLEYSMNITDLGALWARIFGIRFGNAAWIDDYFAGTALPPPIDFSQPDEKTTTQAPFLIAILVALSFLIPFPLQKNWIISQHNRKERWYCIIALTIASLTAGALWTQIRPLVHGGNFLFNVPFVTLLAALGAALLAPVFPYLRSLGLQRTSIFFVLMLYGGILFAPATVYKQGGVFCAVTIMVLGYIFSFGRALRVRNWKHAALFLFSIAVWASIWNPAVGTFTNFRLYTEVLGAHQNTAVLVFAGIMLFLATKPLRVANFFQMTTKKIVTETHSVNVQWFIAGALGLCFALAHQHLADRLFIIPCTLSFPALILAHRKPKYGPLAFFVTIPSLAFFFQFDVSMLAPVAATFLLWQLWAFVRNSSSSMQCTAELVVLEWTTLWTSMGCRINGINFNYFFKWLPQDVNATENWGLQSVLTVLLYSTPTLFGLLLARRIAPSIIENNIAKAWQLARFKLLFVLLFIIGFSLHHAGAGPFLIADVLQESMIWMLIIFFLGLCSHPTAQKTT